MSAPTTMQWLRQAGQRICTGSGRLAAHLAGGAVRRGSRAWRAALGWLGESSGVGWVLRLAVLLGAAALLRKIVSGVAASVYRAVESGAAPGLMWGAAAAWLIAAYRCGRDSWTPRRPAEAPAVEQSTDEEPEDDGQEEDEVDAPQAPAGPRLPDLLDLRVALHAVGTPHAHLAVLAGHIGTTPERVREALTQWQIPIETVRMRGRGASTGVKGGDAAHPSLAYGPDDVAVVAAGQDANNNDNNADGAEFTTVPDVVNPHRTHVVWRDQ